MRPTPKSQQSTKNNNWSCEGGELVGGLDCWMVRVMCDSLRFDPCWSGQMLLGWYYSSLVGCVRMVGWGVQNCSSRRRWEVRRSTVGEVVGEVVGVVVGVVVVQCGREIVEEIYIFLNLVQELGSIIHDFQISNNLLQLKKKACIFLPSSHSNTHVFPPPSPYHPHFTRID